MGILTRIKDASVEDLKKDNPDLYEEIVKGATVEASKGAGSVEELTSQVEELTSQIEKLKGQVDEAQANFEAKVKAIAFASKYGLTDEAKSMLVEGKSVVEVYEHVATKAADGKSESTQSSASSGLAEIEKMSKVFEKTAPPSAGDSNTAEADAGINTFAEARDYIMERDGVSKAEATKRATKEYAQLHKKEFSHSLDVNYGEDEVSLEEARAEAAESSKNEE